MKNPCKYVSCDRGIKRIEQTIFILGKAVPKGRPRFKTIGGKDYVFTPAATRNYEAYIRNCYTEKHTEPMPNVPLRAEITVYFPLNKSDYVKGTDQLNDSGWRKVNGEEHPAKKPDIDNLAKSILDGLNGTAYKDDNQIVELSVRKVYAGVAGVLVTLSDELKGDKLGQ